jgi:hypothetical protein
VTVGSSRANAAGLTAVVATVIGSWFLEDIFGAFLTVRLVRDLAPLIRKIDIGFADY